MLADDTKYAVSVGPHSMLSQSSGHPSLYTLVIIGSALASIPCVPLMLFPQRFWQIDLISGSLKG